jgi:hypothetical protein
MSEQLAHLKIEGSGTHPTPATYRVYLNGQDIAHLITGLTLKLQVNEINTVSIDFLVSKIEMPEEIQALFMEAE